MKNGFMQICKSSRALSRSIDRQKLRARTIGFVPTMGALHAGHLSLIAAAKKENDIVVSSLFVNPLQFGPKEDFKRYPRDFAKDRRLLSREGTHILFAPDVQDFYPPHFQTRVAVGPLSQTLCGVSRPTHFSGVATVVLKLLNLVRPDRLYLGQKDFQQVRVLEQMIEDFNLRVQVRRMPTVREADGLAMSSRNALLSEAERRQALRLSQGLRQTAQKIQSGIRDVSVLRKYLCAKLDEASLGRVDYAQIVDAKTLRPVVRLSSGDELLLAAAVYFSKTRLIDNVLVKVGI